MKRYWHEYRLFHYQQEYKLFMMFKRELATVQVIRNV